MRAELEMQRIQRQLNRDQLPVGVRLIGFILYSMHFGFWLIDYCDGDAWGVWTAGLGIKEKFLELLVFFLFW